MTGIIEVDNVLREMHEQANTWMDKKVANFCELSDHWHITADRIERAVNEFLESKKSFYCTNTECPLKKALKEITKEVE